MFNKKALKRFGLFFVQFFGGGKRVVQWGSENRFLNGAKWSGFCMPFKNWTIISPNHLKTGLSSFKNWTFWPISWILPFRNPIFKMLCF